MSTPWQSFLTYHSCSRLVEGRVFLASSFVKGLAASRAGARTGSRRTYLKCVDFWCPLNVLSGFLGGFQSKAFSYDWVKGEVFHLQQFLDDFPSSRPSMIWSWTGEPFGGSHYCRSCMSW